MAVLASCNKETQETPVPVPSEGDKVYTSFTAGGEDLTKVILNFAEDKNIKWADTDEIAVFDGVGKNTFTIKEGTNEGATAVFEGAVDSGATTLYAVYPASAAGSLNGSSMSVTVPAAQVIGTGACADPAALVAVASAEKGSAMAFKQVCGLLMLSFTAEDIRTITISGQALAGTATVSADGTLGEVSEAANEITLTHADGLFPAGTYYVAVLPGTTPAGQFSISLSNGVKAGFKEGTKAVSFKRLKRLDAGSLDGLTMYTTISTMAELFEWNSTRVVAEESEPDNVMLVADIDMEEEPWVPKDFKGVFDGRGHKLYNLNVERTANACLFNSLTGTVKNLIVGSSDGKTYDGVSKIVQNNPEDTGSSWRYAGLITRLNAGAVLDNVVSFVPVTVAEGSLSKTRIGGLVGVVAGASSISNCENHGAVSNLAAAPKAAGPVGGVIGWADAAITAENVVNYGEITVVNALSTNVGGILARVNGDGSSLSNCSNKASISITGTGETGMYVGGILGCAIPSSGTLKISKCRNDASLAMTHRNVGAIGGVAGYLDMSNGILIIDECENHGDISRTVAETAKGKLTDVCVSGIAANVKGTEGNCSISNCNNYGDVFTNTNAGGTTIRIGGVAAWLQSYTEVKDCKNEGNVRYEMGNATLTGSTIHIAGIVGHLVKGSSVSGCTNSGGVFSDRFQVNRAGGIVGTINSSSAYSCINTGSVDVTTRADAVITLWQAVGGIVGFGEGTTDTRIIKDCVNRGAVSASINAVPQYEGRFGVGGIIGQPFSDYTISGNKNYGSVSAENTNEDTPWSYAGGVMGFDDDAHTSKKASILTDNVNYGEVTNASSSAQYSAAGGLFGRIALATGVTGSSFGTVKGPGAGAVAGVNKTDLTVNVCDAVTVNGVAKAAASDVNAWLCPDNTGTITPKYVAHSAEE